MPHTWTFMLALTICPCTLTKAMPSCHSCLSVDTAAPLGRNYRPCHEFHEHNQHALKWLNCTTIPPRRMHPSLERVPLAACALWHLLLAALGLPSAVLDLPSLSCLRCSSHFPCAAQNTVPGTRWHSTFNDSFRRQRKLCLPQRAPSRCW
jgi:hypothetical protein